MTAAKTILVLSDIHYGSEAECRRGNAIPHPGRRLAVKLYRHFIWMRHPFAHNHMVDRFIAAAGRPDRVVANGDYSCDSAFVGVSDDAALQSAQECLGKLRSAFGERLRTVIGDHELGKVSLGGGVGGLRLGSWHRCVGELRLEPFWQEDLGSHVCAGVTSTLLALPVYEGEMLANEQPDWQRLREAHLAEVRAFFAGLERRQRVVLFCHDPTALPFLHEEPEVRARLDQIAVTIIGHLHTRLVLWQANLLAGIPPVRGLGATIRRNTTALNRARLWRPFKVQLCPALAGIELLREGGYLRLRLGGPEAMNVEIEHCRLPRSHRTSST
jgi:hypothetical protein